MPTGSMQANISEGEELPVTQQQEQSNPTPGYWEDHIHDDPDAEFTTEGCVFVETYTVEDELPVISIENLIVSNYFGEGNEGFVVFDPTGASTYLAELTLPSGEMVSQSSSNPITLLKSI